MKKMIVLMLVLALCLSLCACGGGAGENQKPGTNQSASAPTDKVEPVPEEFKDHPLLSQVYGTWVFEKWGDHNNEYNLYKSLTINEDGTGVVDGIPAVWSVSEDQTNENKLVILIYVDNVCIYGASFNESTDLEGNTKIWLLAFEGEYGALLQTYFNHQ